jgi:hypothetical protein
MWSSLPNLLTIGRLLLVDPGVVAVAVLTLASLAVYMHRWLNHMGAVKSGGTT